MDAICNELAATGLNTQFVVLIVVALLAVSGIGLTLYKKRFSAFNIILPIMIALSFVLLPGSALAQSADNCPDQQTEVPTTDPGDETPENPSDAEITADSGSVMLSSCFVWDTDEFGSLDLMNHFSTTGTSPLIPTTIDLDPSTPGIDSSFTAVNLSGSITFVVDASGVVTMTNPDGVPGNSGSYSFDFTIEDADGVSSTIGTYTVDYLCF